jgi:hypothetical protein
MEILHHLTATAMHLPLWAWATLAVVVAVGFVWLMVDIVTFLFFGALGIIATILIMSVGYPYLSKAMAGFTKATDTVAEAAIAPPVQALEAIHAKPTPKVASKPKPAAKKPKHTN